MDDVFGLWYIVGALLVFFMQAGFAMVEAGFTRAKNAGNIVMKNTLDFSIGAVVFLILGYGLLSGANGNPIIGTPDLSWAGSVGLSGFDWSDFFFQLVFCATATTIVSGAMAERTKFGSYLAITVVICALIYPIETHWVWGGGWLSDLGFLDWAGSGVIHMVGGIIAFMGAALLGPRIGKYDPSGKSNAIPGHSITLGALGVFILWFGWYGFNGAAGSTVDEIAAIFCTTTLSAVAAAIAAMVASWIMGGKPDVTYTLNGALAGLVGITAGCAYVDAEGSLIIGIVCGLAVVFGCEFIDKKLHVDDPVGASSVHGICGLLGTVMTGLFAVDGGLFYGGGVQLFGVQCLGVLAIAAWTVVTAGVAMVIIKKVAGLRVSSAEELEGLDITEHGLTSAYADFLPVVPSVASATGEEVDISGLKPLPVKRSGDLTRVSIICNQTEFVRLKDTLARIGVTGMTVSNVMGCGIEKGKVGSYRGVKTDVNLLPKLQVDVVVSEVDPGLVVAAASKALHTGSAGDGKIFVSGVEDVMRISTGQTGTAALDMTTEVGRSA